MNECCGDHLKIRSCRTYSVIDERKKWAHLRIRSVKYNQGFWIALYFRIRHSFAHLRPVILSADWSISRLQSWTCSSLPTVAEFVKLTQSIVIEIQRQSADLCKVHFCSVHSDLRGKGIRVSPADIIKTIIDRFETHLPLRWLPLFYLFIWTYAFTTAAHVIFTVRSVQYKSILKGTTMLYKKEMK